MREAPNPVVFLEVLSESTAARDVTRDLVGYFSLPSVIHYLILDPEFRIVFHYRRSDGGVIEMRILQDGALRLDPPGLDVPVGEMFPED